MLASMHASVIWYRARPSDELDRHLRDTLATVNAEVSEENMTVKAEQIPSLLAAAMRSSDVTVTVGGMDLRRDDENIIFLAAKCIRIPLEKGRYSRSRFTYDPMRGARLPSFESAVLFPSASGGAEGAVLSTGDQTIILLPRLENSNTDILDLIAEYLPMILGLPENSDLPPEESEPDDLPVNLFSDSEPENEYYDEKGNRLPKYIERVLARKEKYQVERNREITGSELSSIFRDNEDEAPSEDNLFIFDDEGASADNLSDYNKTPPLTAAQRRLKGSDRRSSSQWEQMFEDARTGNSLRARSAERYKALLSEQENNGSADGPQRKFVRRSERADREQPVREREKRPANTEPPAPAARTRREPQPLASAARKNRTPNVNISLKNTYRPTSRSSSALPEPPAPASKPLSHAAAPAFRAAAILLIVSIIISTCYIAFNGYEPGVIEEQTVFYQSELASLFDDPNADSSGLPFGAYSKFAALYAENNDVSGYISIPGTDIAQPIMRSYSSTPDFYAKYSFYGKADSRGSLYFDSGNVFEWGQSNYNLVVYGNSPSDGSMFAGLHNYTDAQFLSEHSLINLDTLYEEGQWLVFSVCLVSSDTVDEFNYSNTSFVGPYSHQVHLYNLYIRSMFYTNTEVLPDEQILTLVTDSDEFTGAKLLVCARKVRDGEDLSQAGANVISNPNVMMPDLWYELNGTQMPAIPELELPTTASTTVNPMYTATTTTTTTTAATTVTAGTTAATQPGETTASTVTTTVSTEPTTTAAPTTLDASYARNMRITSGGKIIEGTASDVLAMIIEAEMGSGYELEALKAQSVASYTYYLYAGGSAKAPSFPTKTAGDRAKQAAKEVLGQYMIHGGTVPYTPYYATSAGITANNSDINVADLSWLVSVDCSVDEGVVGFRTEKQASSAIIAHKVMETKGIDLTAIEDKSTWFEVMERDANDLYVLSVRVGDQMIKGNSLHLSVLGYSYLRSPCFWIEYDEGTDMFHFISLGYGTGVGMSQTGANEYAKLGHNYVWILQHFYPGVTLTAN